MRPFVYLGLTWWRFGVLSLLSNKYFHEGIQTDFAGKSYVDKTGSKIFCEKLCDKSDRLDRIQIVVNVSFDRIP